MKKCPFCKAEIEENARFCLYCMKTLNEKEIIQPNQKKKSWLPVILIGALLLALLLVAILLPKEPEALPGDTAGTQTLASTGAETTGNTQREEPLLPEQTQAEPDQPQGALPEKQEEKEEPSVPAQSTKPDVTPTPTQPEIPAQTTTPATEPEQTTAATTQPEETKPAAAVYTYRAARAGDDFNAQYANSGNDIVITGIAQQTADGVYHIPAYIDGQRVIAITSNAFNGSNARVVYIPETVKNIWNYAFYGCPLTDIYFRGSAIYVEGYAFNGRLTIHCAASCSDRNFRYFKNSAANYGATWEEWNG